MLRQYESQLDRQPLLHLYRHFGVGVHWGYYGRLGHKSLIFEVDGFQAPKSSRSYRSFEYADKSVMIKM